MLPVCFQVQSVRYLLLSSRCHVLSSVFTCYHAIFAELKIGFYEDSRLRSKIFLQLAIAAGVTEVTVRNRIKELLKEANVNSLLSQYGLVIAVRK